MEGENIPLRSENGIAFRIIQPSTGLGGIPVKLTNKGRDIAVRIGMNVNNTVRGRSIPPKLVELPGNRKHYNQRGSRCMTQEGTTYVFGTRL